MIRLRWMSNFTDVDALAAEPGVSVRYTRSPADIERADLVVLPGTKATVEDLERLRADGLDVALQSRRGPILGICGGYQMLGHRIEDGIESADSATGLGLLDLNTTFAPEKLLRQVTRHRAGRRRPPATRSATAASTATSRSSRTATCSAPPGTACSKATQSAASCSAGWPSAPAATWTPGTRAFASRARSPPRPSRGLVRRPRRRPRVHRPHRTRRPGRVAHHPARRHCVLRLLTTADTEILAAAHALTQLDDDFPEVRCANPSTLEDLAAFTSGAGVVVVRLLGGRRAWPEGVSELRSRCEQQGTRADPARRRGRARRRAGGALARPAGAVAQAFEYLRHGGVDNTRELLQLPQRHVRAHGLRVRGPAAARGRRLLPRQPRARRPPARRRRLLPQPLRHRQHGVHRRARPPRSKTPAARPSRSGPTPCAATPPR